MAKYVSESCNNYPATCLTRANSSVLMGFTVMFAALVTTVQRLYIHGCFKWTKHFSQEPHLQSLCNIEDCTKTFILNPNKHIQPDLSYILTILSISKESWKPHIKTLRIFQFKNGNLIPSIKSKLKFTCYTKDGKNARILVANSKRLSYIGSNFESNMSKIATSMLKVCVLNKKSSTVKLYDADFFQMKPHLKAPNVIDVKSDKSYMEKSSDLTLAFGSKIQKKKINTNMKYNSNSMNSDAVDNILNTMLKTPFENSTTTSSTESSVSSAIPPRNDSAPTVDEVYNIYDIISKEELDVLDSDAEFFLDVKANVIQQWKSENKYPSFILQFLEQNFCSMNVYKAKLLCYLNYMFRFLKTTYADWKKKEPIPVSDVPEPFRQKIMESFTINKQMPMRLKDKLLAYALVLALKLNSYCINANIFAASTKVSSKRMTSVAYALGCHTSESKSDAVKMIYLKLPLYKFQELPKKRKK